MRLFICCLYLAVAAAFNANENCFSKYGLKNTIDSFADPNDCHYYYQCFYLSSKYAVGIRQKCPSGTYWRQNVLQCLMENPSTPCSDICDSNDAPESGCYQVETQDSCRSYFVCSNGGSHHFCCPMYTRFNTTSCRCALDFECTKPCTRRSNAGPQIPLLQPVKINSTACTDAQGNTLIWQSKSEYGIVDKSAVYAMSCSIGTEFSVETCRCEGFANLSIKIEKKRLCSLYLPFDENLRDYSNSRFSAFGFGNFRIDQTIAARGIGSLHVSDGRIEIPGFKTRQYQKETSWCVFFKADDLESSGGVMSAYFSFGIAYLGDDEFFVNVGFKGYTYQHNWDYSYYYTTADSFTQVCVLYNSSSIQIYENNMLMTEEDVTGKSPLNHFPIVLGTDPEHGNFTGYIDEVLVCDFQLTRDEVGMHMAGQTSLMNAGLIPMNDNHESFNMPSYSETVTKPSPYGACGHSKYWNAGERWRPKFLQIVGGLDATESEFPWQISLPSKKWVWCGGSVISEKWILTAGHCCLDMTDPVSDVIVYNSLTGMGMENGNNISRFIIHPDYDDDTLAYDFCLLEVAEPVDLNSWDIQPICLPTSCEDENLCDVGELTLTSGYGDIAWNHMETERLKFIQVPLVSSTECEKTFDEPIGTLDANARICAGWRQGDMDSCSGDSGGPLACYKNGFFVLQGITSDGIGCAEAHYPGIYSNVCLVLDWIFQYIGPLPTSSS